MEFGPWFRRVLLGGAEGFLISKILKNGRD